MNRQPVPFMQAIVDDPKAPHEHPRDAKLAGTLRAEAPGILAWLVRGCREWQREGLTPCESIRRATVEYQREEDPLADFIEACCVVRPEAQVKSGVLYGAYAEWARGARQRETQR